MKNNFRSKRTTQILIIIAALAIFIVGVFIWYFSYKKPHDQAIAKYTAIVSDYNSLIPRYDSVAADFDAVISDMNTATQKLDDVIVSAQNIIDSNEPPYDEATLTHLENAIKKAEESKKEVPSPPEKVTEISTTENDKKSKTKDIEAKTDDIISEMKLFEKRIQDLEKETTKLASEPLDYSSTITDIQEKQKVFENSILVLKQITNPSEDFIIQRLKKISSIMDIQAVTEDNDPNGHLNKQGGYTASVYFSSSLVDQSDVYGTDTVDKGTDCGGCIEVYTTTSDAEKREVYLSSYDGTILDSGSHNVLGTILIRTSSKLTATQQKNLEKEIIEKFLEL